jgi:hypothetical protein
VNHTDTTPRRCFAILIGLLVLMGLLALSFAAPHPLRITRITPSGADVPAGRQIVLQFDRPVVPLGRMSRKGAEIPIVITPSLKCQWRWLNGKSLACQLDDSSALKPATRYTLQIDPGIIALDGSTLDKPVHHTFTTLRPKVRNTWFKTWSGPGTPIIRLTFNQPVFKDSVAQHIYFTADQKGKSANGRSRCARPGYQGGTP